MSISISLAVSSSEPHTAKSTSLTVVTEIAKCFSCGFTEDCTPSYILHVCERYEGRWLCGLCMEAVKDEVVRAEKHISGEEALKRHISFCHNFRDHSFHEHRRSTPCISTIGPGGSPAKHGFSQDSTLQLERFRTSDVLR